ncbi:hypothetical protein PV08_00967 [Exophiala spinifera]|uniref:G-protein coupled receptors family 1 profile domain-containing protein n=1 Tax=Exophiala spinifera TaxID=91928 RepID=A0A0D2A6J3_9EURO|nr:uncharacterized protein PV08_00967 [Exophiala spinifera]KIW20392.1 hypothetical protein PV08_00967 [Exophiala spinifera]
MQYSAYSVVFSILAFTGCLACIPPLVVHIRAGNTAAIILTVGVIIMCSFNALNALLWPTAASDTWWNGKILCDIEAKLYFGQAVSFNGVLLCLFRHIASILDTDRMSLGASRRQRMVTITVEIGLCIVLPCIVMAAHCLVSPQRYWIRTIAGCTPSLDNSWPSLVLIYMWPMALCLAACIYCVRAMVRLWRHRKEMSTVLSSTPGVTRSQHIRLISFSAVLLLIYLPLDVIAFAGFMRTKWHLYSWAYNHPADWSDIVVFVPQKTVSFDRWSQTFAAYILFGFYGTGHEATRIYSFWIHSLKQGLRRGDGWKPNTMGTVGISHSVPPEASDSHVSTETFQLTELGQ